ncbi:outer membrane protein [Bosea sp. RAF48]|uniref:outer membrane protein n=1 Tax=Bosea sp. RAF48 TaxID=3237480 RepID=UPI003F90998F
MSAFITRFYAGIAFAACSITAQAADLPSRKIAPVVPLAPAFTWSGFYIGAQAGWAQTRTELTAGAAIAGGAAATSLPSLNRNGAAVGLLLGYNYQIGHLVLGGEIDGAALITGKQRYTALTGDFITAHTNWVGSARLRVGYAFDRFMIYATGGLALAAPKSTVTGTGYSFGAGDSTRVGWTLGAGAEYTITNNWIAGLEYRYSQFEENTFTYPNGVGGLGIVGFKQQLSTNQVVGRLLYKF